MSIEYVQKYVALAVSKKSKISFVDSVVSISPYDLPTKKILVRGESLQLFDSLKDLQKAIEETKKYKKRHNHLWDKIYYLQPISVMLPVEKSKKRNKINDENK